MWYGQPKPEEKGTQLECDEMEKSPPETPDSGSNRYGRFKGTADG